MNQARQISEALGEASPLASEAGREAWVFIEKIEDQVEVAHQKLSPEAKKIFAQELKKKIKVWT